MQTLPSTARYQSRSSLLPTLQAPSYCSPPLIHHQVLAEMRSPARGAAAPARAQRAADAASKRVWFAEDHVPPPSKHGGDTAWLRDVEPDEASDDTRGRASASRQMALPPACGRDGSYDVHSWAL